MDKADGRCQELRLAFRPAESQDEEFLFKLYCSTREAELAAWNWDSPQKTAFFQMQFRMQRQSYAANYPQADHEIAIQDGLPVGRTIVNRTESDIRLVDIAILSEHRNLGIGTAIVGRLIAECAAPPKKLALSVQRMSPARKLYERLGFSCVSENQMYAEMEYSNGQVS
jgi:GNAT superfamily N-acetyltransferase